MNTLHQILDGAEWSESRPPLVAVVFRQNRGANYPQAVETARSAALYRERQQGKTLLHVAVFSRNEEQASLASTLLELLVGIKGTLIYDGDGNRIPNEWTAKAVLECYANSGLSRDYRAHCHRVIDDPFDRWAPATQPDRYILPCRLIDRFRLRLAWDHPASVVEQLHAAGVDSGCHWCPNFDAEAFRKVGDRSPTPGEARELERLLRDVDLDL